MLINTPSSSSSDDQASSLKHSLSQCPCRDNSIPQPVSCFTNPASKLKLSHVQTIPLLNFLPPPNTISNHMKKSIWLQIFKPSRYLEGLNRASSQDSCQSIEAAHSLVRALIHTRVDYCNGLLAAGPKYLHEKLQCVLRAAARLVLQLPHRASVSDIMRRQLHWLDMPDRIRFKLCTLVFRCLHGLAPRYLSDLCTPATVHTHLRSSVTLERSLSVPRTKTKTLGPRGFYFASSAAWNALPVHLRDPGLSMNNFKIKLKTHFFS